MTYRCKRCGRPIEQHEKARTLGYYLLCTDKDVLTPMDSQPKMGAVT